MSTSSHDDQDNIRERELGWNKRKPLSRSHTPELMQGPSHGISLTNVPPALALKTTPSRRGSSASHSSFDGETSKKSSIDFGPEREHTLKIILRCRLAD